MPRFKNYRKVTPTVARVLTEIDFQEQGGVIKTPEGPKSFLPGDYLAIDAKGSWPIPVMKIRTDYERRGLTEGGSDDGYAEFLPLDVREAAQMEEPFEVNDLTGKAGDYLVKSGENWWPVDREVFEASYQEIVSQS